MGSQLSLSFLWRFDFGVPPLGCQPRKATGQATKGRQRQLSLNNSPKPPAESAREAPGYQEAPSLGLEGYKSALLSTLYPK